MDAQLVGLVDAENAPLLARRFYGAAPPSPIVASLAQVPELLEVTMPFLGLVLGPSALDERTKEIVILRTSACMECRYCVQTHTPIARDAGLHHDEVAALRGDASIGDAFEAPAELALIAWVDALTAGPGPLDPAVGRRLAERFGEPAIAELTLLCGATLMLNRYCTALGLPTSAATLDRLSAEGLT